LCFEEVPELVSVRVRKFLGTVPYLYNWLTFTDSFWRLREYHQLLLFFGGITELQEHPTVRGMDSTKGQNIVSLLFHVGDTVL
jgi:hypothetical protein